jgi:threonine/homoserine/homoserine lactone efflux protein
MQASGESLHRTSALMCEDHRIVRQAIGEVLPLAIAAAVSPFPIIGVVLMLTTPRARANGPLFVVGWVFGLAAVGAIGLTVATAAGSSNNGEASTNANIIEIVLGSLLIVFAVRQWRSRPKLGETAKLPKWMAAVDHVSAPKAAGLGFVLSAVNPKNLLLTLAAATTIAATNISGVEQVAAFVVYALIATIGVAVPLAIFWITGDRSTELLNSLKTWLAHNNATIMAVIFLLIGAKVLGQGIAG